MYHYTYEITYTNGKKYIGVRSSKVEPTLDTKYVGSSKVTDNSKIYTKIILKQFNTRQEAIAHEMYLQRYNNVVQNKQYYNMSIQTSIGFDVTGSILSDEHKHKISIATAKASKAKWTEELRNKVSILKAGVPHGPMSQETKDKIKLANAGQESWSKGIKFEQDYILDKYNSRVVYKEKYNWINKETNEEKYATCQEMGLMYGTKRSRQFIQIVLGIAKSYHKWTLVGKLNNG